MKIYLIYLGCHVNDCFYDDNSDKVIIAVATDKKTAIERIKQADPYKDGSNFFGFDEKYGEIDWVEKAPSSENYIREFENSSSMEDEEDEEDEELYYYIEEMETI